MIGVGWWIDHDGNETDTDPETGEAIVDGAEENRALQVSSTDRVPEKNMLAKQLGEALREARETRQWGVRELARRIGVAPGQIGVWEAGRRAPYPLTTARILGALGVVGEEMERIQDLALLARLGKLTTFPAGEPVA